MGDFVTPPSVLLDVCTFTGIPPKEQDLVLRSACRGLIDFQGLVSLIKCSVVAAKRAHELKVYTETKREPTPLNPEDQKLHRSHLAATFSRVFACGKSLDILKSTMDMVSGVGAKVWAQAASVLKFNMDTEITQVLVGQASTAPIPFLCSTSGGFITPTSSSVLHCTIEQLIQNDQDLADAMDGKPLAPRVPGRSTHLKCTPQEPMAFILVSEPDGPGSTVPPFLTAASSPTTPGPHCGKGSYSEEIMDDLVRIHNSRAQFDMLALRLRYAYIFAIASDKTYHGRIVRYDSKYGQCIFAHTSSWAKQFLFWADPVANKGFSPQTKQFFVENMKHMGVAGDDIPILMTPRLYSSRITDRLSGIHFGDVPSSQVQPDPQQRKKKKKKKKKKSKKAQSAAEDQGGHAPELGAECGGERKKKKKKKKKKKAVKPPPPPISICSSSDDDVMDLRPDSAANALVSSDEDDLGDDPEPVDCSGKSSVKSKNEKAVDLMSLSSDEDDE
jgi:hypothetical protein